MAGWRIAEIVIDNYPTPFWRMLSQLGVTEVVGKLPRGFPDWTHPTSEKPWDYFPLARYKRMIEEEGLKLVAIEDTPPMDAVRCLSDGRKEELENICRLIENMGKLGIGIWCYSWSARAGWMRTSTELRGRGGAITTGFDEQMVKDSPPFAGGPVASDTLWQGLEWFLKGVIPTAEKAGVRLALHPDDPPLASIRGVSRIMNTVPSFDRLLELYPSEANGITLCQGNFTLMTDDLPSVIRHFGKSDKIFFVHFRDVQGSASNFVETFLDQGKTNMAECVRAYRDIGFDGIMRCDHTPTIEGDSTDVPGYSNLARLHAIGYMTALRQAISSETPHEQAHG